MIRLIGFDLDETIGNSVPLCIECFRRALEPFAGRVLPDHEITANFGLSEIGTFMRMVPDHISEAYESYIAWYLELHPVMCPAPFPGIPELLFSLKNSQIPLVLITGKGDLCCELTLNQYGLGTFFDAVRTGDPVKSNKAANMRSLLAQYHCSPSEMLYIGDAPSDITASRECGVTCLSAAWAPGVDLAVQQNLNPDNICRTVSELVQRLHDLGIQF